MPLKNRIAIFQSSKSKVQSPILYTNANRSCHPERVKPATNDSVAVLRDVRIQVNKAIGTADTFFYQLGLPRLARPVLH